MYTIYGQPNCAACETAKEAVTLSSKEYRYIDVNEDWVAQEMFREKGFRSVPQVFLDDQHIGGAKDLIKHLANDV